MKNNLIITDGIKCPVELCYSEVSKLSKNKLKKNNVELGEIIASIDTGLFGISIPKENIMVTLRVNDVVNLLTKANMQHKMQKEKTEGAGDHSK